VAEVSTAGQPRKAGAAILKRVETKDQQQPTEIPSPSHGNNFVHVFRYVHCKKCGEPHKGCLPVTLAIAIDLPHPLQNLCAIIDKLMPS